MSSATSAVEAQAGDRWYVVQALSNYEKRVAEVLQEAIDDSEVGGAIREVLVPTETVVELRRGQRREVERRFMPGYVLVRMRMTDESYHFVTEMHRVIGFLGPTGAPTPLPPHEVQRIKSQVEEGVERPRPSITFQVGEQVRIVDGPFESFTGIVEDVDEENARLRLTVNIFSRRTPTDLEYSQVQKTS